MRTWGFANGINVVESKFDYDLHCFDVYASEKFLGTVYPADLDDMQECIKKVR